MPDKDAIHLHFSDLKLLMENYQNVVQLNTLLLEQQKQIIDLQKELVKSQTAISDRQSKVYNNINDIVNKINKQNDIFQQLNDLVRTKTKDMDLALHGRFNTTDQKVDAAKSSVTTMNLDMVKQHSGLTNKIYVALVGSAVIILTLLGLLVAAIERFKLIGNINTMVDSIMHFLKMQ